IVTAYAIHQHRLFDIQFFIPWSKVRARKTAFYDRIRAMIAEIADLGSVREAVQRLSGTLGCSVALVSTGKPVLAVAGGAQQMVAFPLAQLRNIDRIVVANEISDSSPETYRIMRSHGVAAVVPFYPHSQSASGWMLLGDNFSEQVYTPLDFKMVEQLFDKMAELFLDKLLLMRSQLSAAERRLQNTELRLQQAEAGIATLRNENTALQQLNLRLTREQATDSLLVPDTSRERMLPNIILLGRDKPLLKRLRRFFPQADQFVGPDSSSFRRQNLPDVLVCRVDADKDMHPQWRTLITELRGRAALLLHGDGAYEFIAAHLDVLAGTLAEVVPKDATDEALVRRIQALAGLRRAVCAITDPNCPLIGVSQVFHDTMRDAARFAGFAEPVLIESRDTAECTAVARYMHDAGGRAGRFQVAPAACAPEQRVELFASCQNGTLLLTDVDSLGDEPREHLLAEIKNAAGVRVILAVTTADNALREHFHSFLLRLATLRERRLDLPLLVHYFTLQYNLRAGAHAYLTQAEVDDLMTTQYPENMGALKTVVFECLNAKHRSSVHLPEMEFALASMPLEEHVAAFEARLIEQTLKRCQGNKSKAARQLGLRPNTLHYKIERYGLGDPKGKSGDR
ncbi:MAG TPA: helix-turn-helix domain-containing protein, partial [Burkholderiales bacterium]|nr:helix-turn-helix domain-containing protein [Burkholderiales bacterium]